jgi:glutamyl-tRNA reductase
MSLVVLGLSHHGAPLPLLEAVALDDAARAALEADVLASEHVREVVVLSTCNRTEVYAECLTFHGALLDVTTALGAACGIDRSLLQPHLYVHYEDRGIAHAFTVAAGLDSMAVGEAQILGQVRRALTDAQAHEHVGPALNALFQQALRVGKRVHAETDLDLVSGSLVRAGLTRAEAALGAIAAQSVLVVGAGGMGALAATTVARMGAREVVVVNRDAGRARSLAHRAGGTARPLSELPDALAGADVVVSSTGAPGQILSTGRVAAALAARGGRPQVYIDLALPHDVDLDVAGLPGATRVGLAELGDDLARTGSAPQVTHAREMVTGEVAAYLLARSAEAVAPTVTALRTRAGELVADELARLERRTPGMGPVEREEVRRTLHRLVDKLLHTPTVRVKELAETGQGGDYARALSELFDLDPRDVSLVSAPPTIPGEET